MLLCASVPTHRAMLYRTPAAEAPGRASDYDWTLSLGGLSVMEKHNFERNVSASVSRRTLCRAGAGLVGGALLPGSVIGPAFRRKPTRDRHLPGWYIRLLGVHRHYACRAPAPTRCRGEDELKGYQLAVEHINSGHDLIKKISPKTTKGCSGRSLKFASPIPAPSRTRQCRPSSASSRRTKRAG